MCTKANIAKIIRFSAVDGPGNRAAVFFQGCNFNCGFCHNPETIPISTSESRLLSVGDIFDEIGTGIKFIRGITISGGEAMLQQSFVLELFTTAKRLGLDCFIDSNGSIDFSSCNDLLKVTDYIMLDIKSTDPVEHNNLCNSSNNIVMKNLNYLCNIEKLFEIRTVISPNMINCLRTVDAASSIIGKYDKISYKLIKYRPNGVRSDFQKIYKVPSNDFMQEMKETATKNGVRNIIII